MFYFVNVSQALQFQIFLWFHHLPNVHHLHLSACFALTHSLSLCPSACLVCGTWDWTQALTNVRQVLYYLGHQPNNQILTHKINPLMGEMVGTKQGKCREHTERQMLIGMWEINPDIEHIMPSWELGLLPPRKTHWDLYRPPRHTQTKCPSTKSQGHEGFQP